MFDDAAGRSSRPAIVPRNVRFRVEGRAVTSWLAGDRVATAIWDGLSLFLPAGERFFIRSVKHFKDSIEDPALRAEVDQFLAQEGAHSREHDRLNGGLAAEGHDLTRLVAPAHAALDYAERICTPAGRLAVTCAIEHVTAEVAHLLLSDPGTMEHADPAVAALWRWHAVEEMEHKAVAFDLLRRVLQDKPRWRRYWFRLDAFIQMTPVFNVVYFATMAKLIADLPWPQRLWAWLRIVWYFWGRPGLYRRSFVRYIAYMRPGFHPWDHDDRHLLDRWRAAVPTGGTFAP